VIISQDGTVPRIIGTNAAGDASNELSLRGNPLTFTGNGGAGATQMTLDASGNLGIGVTPSANDQGNALFLASGREIIWSGPSGYLSANATYAVGADRYIISGFASSYIQTNGTHIWRTAPSGTAGNAITFTQAMTLDASGNLGVGTTPVGSNRLLEVGPASATQNYIRMNSASNGFALSEYLASGTAAAFVGINASASKVGGITAGTFGIGTPDSYALTLATGNTERARITAAGSVVAGGSVALATTATDGFLYVPTCAGTPTGTPTAITGMAPIIVDTTNNKMYFYSNAAWRDAGP
jgi:hypothetical protein